MIDAVTLRRPSSALGNVLPPHTFEVVTFDLSPEDLRLSNYALNAYLRFLVVQQDDNRNGPNSTSTGKKEKRLARAKLIRA